LRSAVTWLRCLPCLVVALALCIPASSAFDSYPPPPKRSKSDRDVNAIGHRQAPQGLNWYSPAKEKELGDKYAAVLEKSVSISQERTITSYVDQVAQHIAQNSDTALPITVRIINSREVAALTLPGGYLYVSTGLLLQLQSEGELAAVLARGIAHTALRSVTAILTRAALAGSTGTSLGIRGSPAIPMAMPCGAAADALAPSTSPLLLLHFCRTYELDADYFGIQYLYKSGYDPDCFVDAIQRFSPAANTHSETFGPLPPTFERLRLLHAEIARILPRRDTELVSRSEFTEFQERLRRLMPAEPKPKRPTLIRLDSSATD